ncbi:hypothetical protein FACS1894137_12490 [Spirochaetia bacterium]|nr:hypothetical protein FACS1894137_12490 [Spirochaetia bacterium]
MIAKVMAKVMLARREENCAWTGGHYNGTGIRVTAGTSMVLGVGVGNMGRRPRRGPMFSTARTP